MEMKQSNRKVNQMKKSKKAKVKTVTPEAPKEKHEDRAEDQAAAQLESICEMMAALDAACNDDDDKAREEAEQTIHEDPLSVQVREGWKNPGVVGTPEEFEILLCTGGPAVRIIGDLNEHMEPDNPRLEYQDWFTPWVEYRIADEKKRNALLEYCRQFYFGE
jgi:hypothetical protein